jgi:hypothetical protein
VAGSLELDVLDGRYAVARLDPDAEHPGWVAGGALSAVIRTAAELAVIAPFDVVPRGVSAEGPFAALAVRGPLDFALTGILASLATPLAGAGISILALSTFDTDVLLVRDERLEAACAVLRAAGHRVHGAGPR